MTKRKIILLLVFCGLVFGGWFVWQKMSEPAVDPRKMAVGPIPVQAMTLTTSDVPVFLSGIGNVVAQNSVVIRSRVDGELMALNFEEGQYVEKGTLLAQIDDRTIKAELARAKAEKASNLAQLKTAQLDFKRYDNLRKQDAIATQLVDQQKASVDQLNAAVAVTQAAIDAAEVQLAYTQITAPIAGYIGIRNVDVGNIIRASDANGIATLTQLDPVTVIFSLPQGDLPELQPFLNNEKVTVDVLARDEGDILASGELQTLDNQIDPATGTVRLKAVIPNTDRSIWPGQFVVARIKVKTYENVIAVPVNAIERVSGRLFVYKIVDNKVEPIDVKIAYEDEEIAVIDTVKAGDRIVTDGQVRLKPDSIVQVMGQLDDNADAPKTDAKK